MHFVRLALGKAALGVPPTYLVGMLCWTMATALTLWHWLGGRMTTPTPRISALRSGVDADAVLLRAREVGTCAEASAVERGVGGVSRRRTTAPTCDERLADSVRL